MTGKESAPAPVPQNGRQSTMAHHATCDACGDSIHGVRHKCSKCPDYDMCSLCYTIYRGAHRLEHKFNAYCNPADVPVASNVKNGVSMTGRPLVDVSPPSSPVSTSTAIDSNSPALSVHPAFCDVCSLSICGIRHKCLDCPDYDMCNDCYSYVRHMHHATHTFIKILKPPRVVVHGVYDHGTQQDLEEQPSVEKNSAAAMHGSICDVCDTRIIGVRHKCLDCADYDMCDPCMNTRRYEAHDESHNFAKLGTPGTVIVQRVQESSLAPASATEAESTPSVPGSPLPAPVAMATAPFAHAATCNMCDSRIFGDRYKCVGCPAFDTCSLCFSGHHPELHPHHTFVKASRPEDVVTPPMEQFTTVHPAVCDICHNYIIGIRFKCLHPDCPDFDLCQHCEVLPIPSHPTSHPLVKFKHDYLRDPLSYRAVFSFVEQTRLQSEFEAVPPPFVPVSPITRPSAAPQVEIILPHATHPEDLGENYFPRQSPVFHGPSLVPEDTVTIIPPIGLGTGSPRHANLEPNSHSERPSLHSHRRHAPGDISSRLDPEEHDYDSDLALATALSLSLEISGSASSPKSDSFQAQCPICWEDMTGRATIEAPCGHMLCRTCRADLINSSDSWPTCHMCRTPYADDERERR
ncbi:hypothetical protein BS47DRAFT_1341989 [Hydnum rufescens UP504]|uniref:Uncharacterized protein n=1 Tax=Hydnum rufescens UP504 TaxID=1448309 RepID=A0A9P6DUF1_9AGAM|nr:hypothetical protein BS47DRAFT_1341989 [Hydnum rufescens UP504]